MLSSTWWRTAILRAIAPAFMALIAIVMWLCFSSAAEAQSKMVIRYDRGGLLREYQQELAEITRTGRRVEIRGTCLSSCTIFLSAPNVCVSKDAKLGFHGPRYRGSQMPQERFEYWSEVMASHYPGPVARWYMTDARYRIDGVKVLPGWNLQQMGIPAC